MGHINTSVWKMYALFNAVKLLSVSVIQKTNLIYFSFSTKMLNLLSVCMRFSFFFYIFSFIFMFKFFFFWRQLNRRQNPYTPFYSQVHISSGQHNWFKAAPFSDIWYAFTRLGIVFKKWTQLIFTVARNI